MKSVLLSYSTPMYEAKSHTYFYDHKKNMNMIVDRYGNKMPFIDSNLEQLCISTKTEAIHESDDSVNEMLMISTKTRQEMESDDQSSFNH